MPHPITQPMIRHDLELDDYEFDGILGGLLLCIDEDSAHNVRTGEETITDVHSVEVVGFHIGSNVCLTRDQMIQMKYAFSIAEIETVQLEKRKEAIG